MKLKWEKKEVKLGASRLYSGAYKLLSVCSIVWQNNIFLNFFLHCNNPPKNTMLARATTSNVMLEVGKICNTIELNNPDNCTIHCLRCWQLLDTIIIVIVIIIKRTRSKTWFKLFIIEIEVVRVLKYIV